MKRALAIVAAALLASGSTLVLAQSQPEDLLPPGFDTPTPAPKPVPKATAAPTRAPRPAPAITCSGAQRSRPCRDKPGHAPGWDRPGPAQW